VTAVNVDQHRRRHLRRLALHHEAVRVLQRAPERMERVLEVLGRWDGLLGAADSDRRDHWRERIRTRNLDAFLEDTEAGDELRRGSPLTFALDRAVRSEILRRFGARVA
jgi:hypothetical protein